MCSGDTTADHSNKIFYVIRRLRHLPALSRQDPSRSYLYMHYKPEPRALKHLQRQLLARSRHNYLFVSFTQ